HKDDETKDGPVDYPMDGGDDGDDDDDDSSRYNANDEDEDEEEEEEEHLAPADSVVVITTNELVSLPKGTKPIIPPPSTKTATTGARITVRLQAAMDEVRESSTRGRRVDYGFADTVKAEMRHRAIREVEYQIRDTWIDPAEAVPEMVPTTLEEETVWIVEEEAYAAREAWAHSIGQIMAPVTRQGQMTPPPNTDTPPHHMTPESLQAMIDQALLRNSTNGDGSQSSHGDNPRNVQTTRPCFYANFMKCHPLNFKGNEGVIRTLGPEAYAMTWEVKGNDVPAYTNHFQELALICTKFVANENEKIDKYISGLPDSIYENVRSSKPKTLDENIELTNDLMDQKHRTYVESSVFETTISFGSFLIVPLSICNNYVARASTVTGKVPYLVAFVALLST
nr:hypothetical protein [Tanacetum cinerariifolium]